MEVQDNSQQPQDGVGGEVMDSLGDPDASKNEDAETSDEAGTEKSNDPLYVQKRLKQQKRAHDREMREMQSRMADMHSRLSQQSTPDQSMNPYAEQSQNSSIDEHIHKAVSFALNHREQEERKAKDTQNAAHVAKKYQDFDRHLDQMSDKYDDFHDVVLAHDMPFTATMRDYAARTMSKKGDGSAGEVLYTLAKNKPELERITRLHPDDQAEEMHKLSLALMKGGESKATSPRPLGQIKSNPVSNNSNVVTEKTPIGSIRQRM